MKKIQLITIILIHTFILTGCFEQEDTIWINTNGDVQFESQITITDDLSLKDVEEFSDADIADLTKAGWMVKKEWLQKKEPYKLLVTGTGNLHQIKNASDFYKIMKIDENNFKVKFSPIDIENGKSTRSITFETSFFQSDAQIFDALGKPINKIKNITRNAWYTINLE